MVCIAMDTAGVQLPKAYTHAFTVPPSPIKTASLFGPLLVLSPSLGTLTRDDFKCDWRLASHFDLLALRCCRSLGHRLSAFLCFEYPKRRN